MRWTRPETWHLTLLFLGSVSPERVDTLTSLVDELAADAGGPHEATAIRGGGRLRGRDGVAWLALEQGADRLIALADLAQTRCPADITDGPPPRRTPTAHLTLVRRADAAVIADLRAAAHGPLGVDLPIDRLSLIRSHLGRTGATYETVHESAL